MSEFLIPLRNVMLLQSVIENGGTALCELRRPEQTLAANLTVESDACSHIVTLSIGPLKSSLTLQRASADKYRTLRDFIEDVANGHADSGRWVQHATALADALDYISKRLEDGQVAYITPTYDTARPYGAVVTNARGEICAAVTGSSKEHLGEQITSRLAALQNQIGERP